MSLHRQTCTGEFVAASDGRILSCNPPFAALFGYSSPHDLVSASHHLFDPDIRLREDILRELQRYTKVEFFEVEWTSPDGRSVTALMNAETVQESTGVNGQIRGSLYDATGRLPLGDPLRLELPFLQEVINSVPEPILAISPDYRVLLSNRAVADQIQRAGLPAPNNGVLHCYDIAAALNIPCSPDSVFCLLDLVRHEKRPVVRGHDFTAMNGTRHALEVTAAPLFSTSGEFQGIIESVRDVTEQQVAQEQIKEHLDRLAHFDPLTALPNRRLFMDRLRHAILKAQRAKETVAVLFLDLDRFKNVNDTFGHEMGDQLLREVAERFQQCVRSSETVARLGGDEFVVILENVTYHATTVIAERLLAAMTQPFILGNREISVSTSIGISLFPVDGNDLDELMQHADSAMYLAKERGRGNFQYYTEALNERTRRHLAVEAGLVKALERREMNIVYQPHMDILNGSVVGVEALLRWESTELGEVETAEFITVADETGLIVPIGEWVLRAACEQGARWRRAGHDDLRVAVNLSKRQFLMAHLPEYVALILAETGFPAENLELEFEERDLGEEAQQLTAIMKRLKGLGVRLTLDNFGSDCSSLSHLKQFPFDQLKISRDVVRGTPDNPADSAIAIAIISLAKNFGITVIPEGVEKDDQLLFFAWYGCWQVQGFAVGHPLPPREIDNLLVRTSLPEKIRAH